MVACATNRNNSKSKKMKTIDKDTTSVPDNPIEEGIGMMLLHKGGATSYGETLVMVSEEQISKKEIAGTSHKAGNSMDLKSDMSSPWWIGTVGMGGATPPLQKQMKMKEEPSEMTLVDKVLRTKSTPWHIAQREGERKWVQKTGPTVALVAPMLQQLSKDVQEYIMPSKDWTKCM